jgi:hypothetical protein
VLFLFLAAANSSCLQGTDKFECVISCRKKGVALRD